MVYVVDISLKCNKIKKNVDVGLKINLWNQYEHWGHVNFINDIASNTEQASLQELRIPWSSDLWTIARFIHMHINNIFSLNQIYCKICIQ